MTVRLGDGTTCGEHALGPSRSEASGTWNVDLLAMCSIGGVRRLTATSQLAGATVNVSYSVVGPFVGTVGVAVDSIGIEAETVPVPTIPAGPQAVTVTPTARPEAAYAATVPVSYHRAVAADGRSRVLAEVAPAGPGTHPAVVILPGSDGHGSHYERLAAMFADRGVVGIVGCWFTAPLPIDDRIACPGAPELTGVNAESAADVDLIVDAARRLPGVDPSRVAVWGFSRGAGLALLRASGGRTEPVVAVSPYVYPPAAPPFGAIAGEIDVVSRAGWNDTPVLVQYGLADTTTPPDQHARPYIAAAARSGHPVGATAYSGLAHNPWESTRYAEIVDEGVAFVHRTLD